MGLLIKIFFTILVKNYLKINVILNIYMNNQKHINEIQSIIHKESERSTILKQLMRELYSQFKQTNDIEEKKVELFTMLLLACDDKNDGLEFIKAFVMAFMVEMEDKQFQKHMAKMIATKKSIIENVRLFHDTKTNDLILKVR